MRFYYFNPFVFAKLSDIVSNFFSQLPIYYFSPFFGYPDYMILAFPCGVLVFYIPSFFLSFTLASEPLFEYKGGFFIYQYFGIAFSTLTSIAGGVAF